MDRQTHVRTDCAVCHTNGPMTGQAASILLKTRSDFPRQAWAEAIPLSAKCGVCHLVPPPSALRRGSWVEVVSNMQRIMELRRIPPLTPVERADVLHYYYTFSPEELPALPEDPDPAASPLKFQARALGMAKSPDSREHPAVGHV